MTTTKLDPSIVHQFRQQVVPADAAGEVAMLKTLAKALDDFKIGGKNLTAAQRKALTKDATAAIAEKLGVTPDKVRTNFATLAPLLAQLAPGTVSDVAAAAGTPPKTASKAEAATAAAEALCPASRFPQIVDDFARSDYFISSLAHAMNLATDMIDRDGASALVSSLVTHNDLLAQDARAAGEVLSTSELKSYAAVYGTDLSARFQQSLAVAMPMAFDHVATRFQSGLSGLEECAELDDAMKMFRAHLAERIPKDFTPPSGQPTPESLALAEKYLELALPSVTFEHLMLGIASQMQLDSYPGAGKAWIEAAGYQGWLKASAEPMAKTFTAAELAILIEFRDSGALAKREPLDEKVNQFRLDLVRLRLDAAAAADATILNQLLVSE